jgi:hypothetical protein
MNRALVETPSTSAVTPVAGRSDRWFYVGMALAMLAVLAVGFAPSFYLRPPTRPLLAPRVVAHGIAFSGWMLLFFVQTVLVAAGRTRIHRRLGLAAAGLALAMVVSAAPMAVAAAGRGVPPPDALAFLLVMLVDLLLFCGFVAAAICYRRRPEIHKRLMLLATLSLLPPSISRWPIAVAHTAVIPAVMLLFLAAAPLRDAAARHRLDPVSLWGALGVLVSIPLRFAIAHTAAWHHIASWLVR